MLSELWNFIRVSFKKKLAIYYIVLLSWILFGSIPIRVFQFVWFFVFVVASGLFLTVFGPQFASNLCLFFLRKNEVKIPVPNEIRELSNRIGGTIKQVRIKGKFGSAFVRGKTLVLGITLLQKLSFNQLQAVVAHESGHIKERHHLLRFLLTLPFMIIPWYSWSRFHIPIFFTESLTFIVVTIMLCIASLAYMIVIMMPVSWWLELRSDEIAARFVGKENIRSALMILANNRNLEEPSEDHPSIAERIKHIEKLKI